jgi:hypothetical protein
MWFLQSFATSVLDQHIFLSSLPRMSPWCNAAVHLASEGTQFWFWPGYWLLRLRHSCNIPQSSDRNYKQLCHYRSFTHSTVYYSTYQVFSVSCVFTSCCLVMASNGRRSRTIPMPQLPASNRNSSQWLNCSGPLTDCSPTNSLHSIVLSCRPHTNWTELGRSSHVALEWTTQKTPLPTVLPLLRAGRCLAVPIVLFVFTFIV